MDDVEKVHGRVIDLFLAATLKGMNHKWHVTVGNILKDAAADG